jgi:hypothetical protein
MLEFVVMHGIGSRKAARIELWFSETTHIALGLMWHTQAERHQKCG